jgi:hypothetical protein
MESIKYYVGIGGKTWGGFEGELELEFDSKPTRAMVKSKAGDFENWSVLYATKITTVQELEAFDVD